jgi:hypothetical protein
MFSEVNQVGELKNVMTPTYREKMARRLSSYLHTSELSQSSQYPHTPSLQPFYALPCN